MRSGRAAVGFRRALPVPPVLTDGEPRRIGDGLPVLFLRGARSALHDSSAVAGRIGRVLPAARVEVVPGAGRSLPIDRPGTVAELILRNS